ncbi:hypothetical protein ACFY4B_27380 [Kitasatospora sp. NPDC001261]|uniref:hypothetical protein n=1 Tax=Kitasatospora sp. NPDC001261 TaxID=3364012 RepID=UPI0036783BC8
MGVDTWVRGTVAVHPPVPLASLWELIEGRGHFAIAPAAASPAELTELADHHELLLIPADGAGRDARGRPTHIKALVVDRDARFSNTLHALDAFAGWCTGHTLTAEIVYSGDYGDEGTVVLDPKRRVFDWVETTPMQR